MKRAIIILSRSLITVFLLTLLLVGSVPAKDGVIEIFGPIKSLPSSGFTGSWEIGTRTVNVTAATIIKQELGPIKVGAIVEAKATPQADGTLTATKIEVKQSVGGGGFIELHGVIEVLPGATDFIGDWTVSGRTIIVTSATSLNQTRGAFGIGVQIEVEGFLQTDGTINASKIKSHPEDFAEDFKFFGTIGAMPDTANLVGDWTISGKTVHVTATTQLEQERQRFAVGVYVIVEGIPQSDGSVTAKEIKTVIVTTTSAASFAAGNAAAETIVSGFGSLLSEEVQVATSLPLPVSLSGTSVSIRDSAGVERAAPLFFVSPSQVNYQIPASIAPGAATVSITSARGDLVTGTLQIEAVAPGLFSANSSGQGLAAAVALRVHADGSQVYETVARYDDQQAGFVAQPIDLSADDVYLILFGTGLRHHQGLLNVKATVGGYPVEVLYAGTQGGFAGLDQVNLKLPGNLAGSGEVEVEVEVEGKRSNKVKISLR